MKAKGLCPCPFCGGELSVSLDDDERENGMIHSMPMCAKFRKLDALSFAVAVREEMQRRQPS